MLEHALPEAALAAEAALVREAARAPHVQGVKTAQEAEGIFKYESFRSMEQQYALRISLAICAFVYALLIDAQNGGILGSREPRRTMLRCVGTSNRHATRPFCMLCTPLAFILD